MLSSLMYSPSLLLVLMLCCSSYCTNVLAANYEDPIELFDEVRQGIYCGWDNIHCRHMEFYYEMPTNDVSSKREAAVQSYFSWLRLLY
jgi:hypothetical protein